MVIVGAGFAGFNAARELAQRIGPRPQLVAGCLLCAVASMLAVRIGSHAGYWTVVCLMSAALSDHLATE